MAIARFSLDRSKLVIPSSGGEFMDVPFMKDSRAGASNLGIIADDRTLLVQMDEIKKKASQLSKSTAPITFLIHGLNYNPRAEAGGDPFRSDNAHYRNFHLNGKLTSVEEREKRCTSWPLGLGFSDDRGQTGLAIPFAWNSKPSIWHMIRHFKNFYVIAYNWAVEAGQRVAQIARAVNDKTGRPVAFYGHSLGTKVIVEACKSLMSTGQAEIVDRAILVGGAIYCEEVIELPRQMSGTQFFNLASREDDILNRFGENFGPDQDSRLGQTRSIAGQTIGHNGLCGRRADNWIDIYLNRVEIQAWGKDHDHDLAGDELNESADHYIYYTHRGNMAFARHLLRDGVTVRALRDQKIPEFLQFQD